MEQIKAISLRGFEEGKVLFNYSKQLRYPLSFNSPVILSLFFISLIFLILGLISNGQTTRQFVAVYRSSITDPLTWVRLFTHILGHASWQHFLNNFLIIMITGPSVEARYGSFRTLKMILLAAFAIGVLNIVFVGGTLYGASGIAFMFMMLASFTNAKSHQLPLTFVIVAVLYIGNEFFNALFAKDSISQFAHIIGGAMGGLFGWWLNRDNPVRNPLESKIWVDK